MANPWYTNTIDLLPATKARSGDIDAGFEGVQIGFDNAYAASVATSASLALKANLAGGNTWTGAQDFTGATMTIPTPAADANPATRLYVDQRAFNTALPSQTGNAGKWVTTDGTNASWAALPSLPAALVRVARTSNTILAAADIGKWFDITSGTFTQTFSAAATLGSGWWAYLENSGTGDITVDPNASETIDGLTSFIMYPGERRLIQCDGTALRSTVEKAFRRDYTTAGSFTFTKPPGYMFFGCRKWGGGGGGSVSGGGGAACVDGMYPASLIGVTQSVTVGAAGAKNTAGAAAGAGGNSIFIDTAYGGGGANAGTNGGPGGGVLSAGIGAGNIQGAPTSSTADNQFGGASGATGATGAGRSIYGGGGGGDTNAGAPRNGGNSLYGGGGGAGSDGTAGAVAGTSVYGGNGGGNTGATSTPPTAPGGGGAGTIPATNATDGAIGSVIIWGVM